MHFLSQVFQPIELYVWAFEEHQLEVTQSLLKTLFTVSYLHSQPILIVVTQLKKYCIYLSRRNSQTSNVIFQIQCRFITEGDICCKPRHSQCTRVYQQVIFSFIKYNRASSLHLDVYKNTNGRKGHCTLYTFRVRILIYVMTFVVCFITF